MDELRSVKHKLLESAQSEVEKSPNYKQLVVTLGLMKQDELHWQTRAFGGISQETYFASKRSLANFVKAFQ